MQRAGFRSGKWVINDVKSFLKSMDDDATSFDGSGRSLEFCAAPIPFPVLVGLDLQLLLGDMLLRCRGLVDEIS